MSERGEIVTHFMCTSQNTYRRAVDLSVHVYSRMCERNKKNTAEELRKSELYVLVILNIIIRSSFHLSNIQESISFTLHIQTVFTGSGLHFPVINFNRKKHVANFIPVLVHGSGLRMGAHLPSRSEQSKKTIRYELFRPPKESSCRFNLHYNIFTVWYSLRKNLKN